MINVDDLQKSFLLSQEKNRRKKINRKKVKNGNKFQLK